MVSIFLASFLLASFFGSFVWGIVCDQFHTNRKVSIVCFLAAGLIMYVVYFSTGSIFMLAVLYPLLGFVTLPHAVNIDSWLLLVCRNNLSIYGKIRCMPSFMYAVTSMILGRMIAAYGYYVMLIFGTFFLITGIVSALMLPESKEAMQKKAKEDIRPARLKQLFHSSSYRYLIIILFLLGLTIAPMNNLKAAILENVGGDVSELGVDGFISAVTQVPFIAFSDKIAKCPLRIRYIFVTALPFTAFLLAYYAVSPIMIFVGSCLINAGVGILLPTMRSVTEKSVSPKMRNIGHNIADSVYNSVTGIISLLYSGIVIDMFGMKSMLQICTLIVFMAVILASGNMLWCVRLSRKEEQAKKRLP